MSESEEYLHSALTETIIGVFYEVYNELGPGFLESVYHKAFVIALRQAGLSVESSVSIPVFFRREQVGDFVADIVVDNKVLLELKAAREFEPVHESQTLNYLRATDLEVGLLMNFGPKPKFRRFAYANDRKRTPHNQKTDF